ncbi:MAG: IPTL-CTERM sorting domain-containing protein [Usitatibacter sp.]
MNTDPTLASPVRRIFRVASVGLAAILLTSAAAQAQSYLGASLQPFVVLGGTAVTCAGGATFTGIVGVSPATSASITGFPGLCPNPSGGIQGSPAADPAQANLTTAFGTLAGHPCDATVGPDLAGLTLAPGTYCVTAAPSNLTGTLQLDAQGNPNAVWVFQMASTLITSVGSTVSVINGGNACGAQWLVNSSATINTGSTFLGNIVALTNITMNGNLTGRALARNGAVTIAGGGGSFAPCGAFATSGPPLPFPIFGAPGGGGGFAGTGIPTLSQWALIILAGLLAVTGFAGFRTRSRTAS